MILREPDTPRSAQTGNSSKINLADYKRAQEQFYDEGSSGIAESLPQRT